MLKLNYKVLAPSPEETAPGFHGELSLEKMKCYSCTEDFDNLRQFLTNCLLYICRIMLIWFDGYYLLITSM